MKDEDSGYEPGDLVRLRSGGPAMTVCAPMDKLARVRTLWFSPDAVCLDGVFPIECLEDVDDGELPGRAE